MNVYKIEYHYINELHMAIGPGPYIHPPKNFYYILAKDFDSAVECGQKKGCTVRSVTEIAADIQTYESEETKIGGDIDSYCNDPLKYGNKNIGSNAMKTHKEEKGMFGNGKKLTGFGPGVVKAINCKKCNDTGIYRRYMLPGEDGRLTMIGMPVTQCPCDCKEGINKVHKPKKGVE